MHRGGSQRVGAGAVQNRRIFRKRARCELVKLSTAERERAIGSESGSVLATPSKLCTVIFQGDDSLFNVILLVKARRLSPHRTKTTMRDDWDMNHSTSTNYRHCLSWTHRHCLYLDSSLVTSSANKRKSCSTSTNMFWLRCSMIRRCRGDRQDDDCL